MQLSSAEIVSLSVVNHHNYSLDQEKHQYLRYANEISGFGINIQQEGISATGNGDQTDGSLRNGTQHLAKSARVLFWGE